MPPLRVRKTGQLFIDVGHSSSYRGESHGAHIMMASKAAMVQFSLICHKLYNDHLTY
jgi:hypothetical protein